MTKQSYRLHIEKLSRYCHSPVNDRISYQTVWFFERARGQYKNQRIKEGSTSARAKKFDLKYPKSQVFTKTDLAKYVNSFCEIQDGRKIVIGPHFVVRGNEKNYTQYINNNLPKKVTGIYFEDVISKLILFKEAERRYGVGSQSFKIGDMRAAVVPYTLSLLSYLTDNRIDLYKIWQSQKITDSLSDCLYDLMVQVNSFIIKNSPSSHYIEWAKKEECWTAVKANKWTLCLDSIKNDLTTKDKVKTRKSLSDNLDFDAIDIDKELKLLRSIPPNKWAEIEEWGNNTGNLSLSQQSFAGYDMKFKIINNRDISDSDRKKAINIYKIVKDKSPRLLKDYSL